MHDFLNSKFGNFDKNLYVNLQQCIKMILNLDEFFSFPDMRSIFPKPSKRFLRGSFTFLHVCKVYLHKCEKNHVKNTFNGDRISFNFVNCNLAYTIYLNQRL